MEEDGGVEVESSWSIVGGSLQDCISVQWIEQDEGHIHPPPFHKKASSPLILVPFNDSAPCEITVKFRQNLGLVHHLHIVSTARICELYSQNETNADADYACTLRAEILKTENINLGMESSSEKIAPSIVDLADGHFEINPRRCDCSDGQVNQVQNGTNNVPFDEKHHNVRQIISEDDKGDSSFLSIETLAVRMPTSSDGGVQSDAGSMVEATFDQEIQASKYESDSRKAQQKALTSLKTNRFANGFESYNTCNISESYLQAAPYFEAKTNAVSDHPWASLKVKLLSLFDKSFVRVSNITIYAKAGLPVASISEPSDSQPRQHDSFSPSLLAMLVPGMLQVARALPDKRNERHHAHGLQVGTTIQGSKSASEIVQSLSQPSTAPFRFVMGAGNAKGDDEHMGGQPLFPPCLKPRSSSHTRAPDVLGAENTSECIARTHELGDEAHTKFQDTVHKSHWGPSSDEKSCFQKEIQAEHLQVAAERLAADHTLCAGGVHETSSSSSLNELNLSRFVSHFDSTISDLRKELVAHLSRLEIACLRLEFSMQSTIQSFDHRLQALELHNKRKMDSESDPSVLSASHISTAGDSLIELQQGEAFDVSLRQGASSTTHGSGVDPFHSSIVPCNFLECAGCASLPLSACSAHLSTPLESSSTSSPSFSDMPSYTCVESVKVQSSALDSKSDISCSSTVVSSVIPLDRDTKTDQSQLESTLSYSSLSMDSSLEIHEAGVGADLESKDVKMIALPDSPAIVQPKKALSLDEALLSALSAFSTSNLPARHPESVGQLRCEVFGKTMESEACLSRESVSCDSDSLETSYFSFKSSTSQASQGSCQTIEVIDHSSGVLEDKIFRNSASQELHVSKSAEIFELPTDAAGAIPQRFSCLEIEEVTSGENDSLGGETDLDSILTSACEPSTDHFDFGSKNALEDQGTAEPCKEEVQHSETTFLDEENSFIVGNFRKKSDDLLWDLISWNEQTLGDPMSLDCTTMADSDIGKTKNACHALNKQASNESGRGLPIAFKEMPSYMGFGDSCNALDNKTSTSSESKEEDADILTHRPHTINSMVQAASNGLQSDIDLSDLITAWDEGKNTKCLENDFFDFACAPTLNEVTGPIPDDIHGKDIDCLEVGFFDHSPTVNKVNNIPRLIPDDLLACNTTQPMDRVTITTLNLQEVVSPSSRDIPSFPL